MNWALYTVAAILVLSALITVSNAGKPGHATTGAMAVATILLNGGMAIVCILAALRLS